MIAEIVELKSELQALTNRVCTLESMISKAIAEKHDAGESVWKATVKRKIDPTKLPVDTPVLVRDFETDQWISRHFAGASSRGKTTTFNDGKTSFSGNDDRAKLWLYFRIDFDACKPVFWQGGEQPVPDGVRVRAWYRPGGVVETEASTLEWDNSKLMYDEHIIGYQMIGIAEGYEE